MPVQARRIAIESAGNRTRAVAADSFGLTERLGPGLAVHRPPGEERTGTATWRNLKQYRVTINSGWNYEIRRRKRAQRPRSMLSPSEVQSAAPNTGLGMRLRF